MFEAGSSPICISAGQVTDDTNNNSASNFFICTGHATRMSGTTLQIFLFPMTAVLIMQAFEICLGDLSAHQTQISNPIHIPAHHLKRRFCPLIPKYTKTSKRSAGQSTDYLFVCICYFPIIDTVLLLWILTLIIVIQWSSSSDFLICAIQKGAAAQAAALPCICLSFLCIFSLIPESGRNTGTVQPSPLLGMIYVHHAAAPLEIVLIYTGLQHTCSSN